ncbi:hypothetical protein LOZ53_001968 [Ophidiomyces ophidiicola]|nr:hypothetical protein LOZ55_005628 [Ophidiomyces ophidiicola]KAI1993907.1 hypothetical protein LOZ54_001259 [Ophidiomyces ophidiicola]KAI1993912.1 hypothetical protein LOZ53_001968 [Ophidiomyces ophidiicola]KAI2003378.1 hypothetical protein LOZ51_000456 [Ophidiomyces ophidiicola]
MASATERRLDDPDTRENIWNDPKIVEDYRISERVTVVFARSLVDQSGVISDIDNEKPLCILDNACGTGALSLVLQETLRNRSSGWKLTCADLSEAMVGSVAARIKEEGWKNTDTAVADMQATGLSANYYTHVFACFGLMIIPNGQKGLDECLRVLKPGGTLGFTVWKKSGWLNDINDAIASMPGDLKQPTPEEFSMALENGDPWHDTDWIKSQLEKRGCKNIQITLVPRTLAPSPPSELIRVLTPLVNFIPVKFWSEEQRKESAANFAPALLEYWNAKYGADTPVPMEWIATVVTACKAEN